MREGLSSDCEHEISRDSTTITFMKSQVHQAQHPEVGSSRNSQTDSVQFRSTRRNMGCMSDTSSSSHNRLAWSFQATSRSTSLACTAMRRRNVIPGSMSPAKEPSG
eukprot:Skav220671  [mRNA]  locus=scaffold1914:178438:187373:- [translate_table: standard]